MMNGGRKALRPYGNLGTVYFTVDRPLSVRPSSDAISMATCAAAQHRLYPGHDVRDCPKAKFKNPTSYPFAPVISSSSFQQYHCIRGR